MFLYTKYFISPEEQQIPTNHLDNATGVLCNRAVYIGSCTRSPHRFDIQQVLPGTFNQLLVLNTHSSQHHPLRTVIVQQVAVKNSFVDLVHVIYRTKAWQPNSVASVCSLKTIRKYRITNHTTKGD